MNPDNNDQNSNRQGANPTAYHYNKELAPSGRSKKFLYIVVLIGIGVALLAFVIVFAYNSTGDRIEEKIDQLESETIDDPNEGNVDVSEPASQ